MTTEVMLKAIKMSDGKLIYRLEGSQGIEYSFPVRKFIAELISAKTALLGNMSMTTKLYGTTIDAGKPNVPVDYITPIGRVADGSARYYSLAGSVRDTCVVGAEVYFNVVSDDHQAEHLLTHEAIMTAIKTDNKSNLTVTSFVQHVTGLQPIV